MHEKRAHFLPCTPASPTKGPIEYMKRKCAQLDASPLTCRSISKYWSYLLEQRVALMLHCHVASGGRGSFTAVAPQPLTPGRVNQFPSPERNNYSKKRGKTDKRRGMRRHKRLGQLILGKASSGERSFRPLDGRGSFHPLKRRRQWLDSASSMVGHASVNGLSSAIQWMERRDSMDGAGPFNGWTITRPSRAAKRTSGTAERQGRLVVVDRDCPVGRPKTPRGSGDAEMAMGQTIAHP